MESIFKYMGFLGLDYFDNPTARISMISELNDPFECKLSTTINPLIEHYTRTLNEAAKKTNFQGEIPESFTENYINSALRGLGVISFSETNRNLLMWAHYANNHKGICLELEPEWSISKKRLENTNSKKIHSFRRVQYDTQRVDFSKYTLSTSDLHESIVELFIKQLTLKSDEWLYEKEHRYIMSLLEADYIKAKGNVIVPPQVEATIEKLIKELKIKNDKNGYVTTDCDNTDLFYSAITCDAFMYLTKIPPQKIKGIYLGHRFNDDDKNKLVEKIKNKRHPLHHASIYKCSISDTRFELNIDRVDCSKLEQSRGITQR